MKIKGAIHPTKIPTGLTGKRGPPQKLDPFFRNFSGWTEPIHWVLDRNFRKVWWNGSRLKSSQSKLQIRWTNTRQWNTAPTLGIFTLWWPTYAFYMKTKHSEKKPATFIFTFNISETSRSRKLFCTVVLSIFDYLRFKSECTEKTVF